MNDLTKNIRLFFHGAYLSYIALFAWLRPTQYITAKLISPFVYMTFFVFLGKFASGNDDASFYVIGNAMQIVSLSGIYGVSMSIDGDRWGGTLVYLFGTPANRLFLFIGRAFMHVLDGILGIIISFILGVLIFRLDLSQTNYPALFLTILVTTLSTSGMGLLLGCLGLMTRNVMFVNNTAFFSLLVFSGANVPIETLPGWARTISMLIPLSRGIDSSRQVVAGASLQDVLPLLGGELLIGLAYIVLGFSLFQWFEQQAKRRGTLEAF
jgi:ABC-2 type transport system permease protein